MKPVIALTMGDPAGIGPELCLKAIHSAEVQAVCRPVILGDAVQLAQAARETGLAMPEAEGLADLQLLQDPVIPGAPTREGGAASYHYLLQAIRDTQAGKYAGICTAPITKTTLKLAGVEEPGHTEILARETGTRDYGMMLYSDRIAVSLVTIHQSLASVPGALRTEEICRIARLGDATLRRLRGRAPRQAILGLNPHAGEGGLFGDEELRVIAPAVEQLRAEGLEVEGPLPPDTAFTPRALPRYDGHVVMYHDQGLIPFKLLAIEEGVNLTMGLPIVRTSPDHGTAYDIAGKNQADARSMIEAIRLAVRLASPAPGVS